jgi:dimethylsulfone monooxygenase
LHSASLNWRLDALQHNVPGQCQNIDHISRGRLSLNVVSSWWADEARKYAVTFEEHDDRYARTSEWLDVVNGVWSGDGFSFSGRYYRVENNVLQAEASF